MADTKTDSKTLPQIAPKLDLKPPPLFKVMYINDEVTTMEFVIESLVEYFNYTAQTAVQITEDIHTAGSAVVAVLPYEVAEQKGVEVTLAARAASYPLQIKLEPESI